MGFFYYLVLFFYLLVCFLLSILVLMQESKSTGLGASFGGDPTQSLFGTSTADVLKRFTGWLSFGFLLMALFLSVWTAQIGRIESPFPVESLEG